MMEWEQIGSDGTTSRQRVPNLGWLVLFQANILHDRSDDGRGMVTGWEWRPALVFISDPAGLWDLPDHTLQDARREAGLQPIILDRPPGRE